MAPPIHRSPPVVEAKRAPTRTSGSCTTGVISSPGNDGRGGLGRRGEETEEAVEVGRRGEVGWLPHRWSEGGLLRQWPGLALPVAVTPGFPPGARRNSQHSPPPAGRPPGSLVLAWPQGSRF